MVMDNMLKLDVYATITVSTTWDTEQKVTY